MNRISYDKKNNIIYELKDGKGFIKNRNYVGEYLNGEKNGKGKEYEQYNNRLLFEGEYLNGKKWNGIFYNIYSDEIFLLKDGKGFIKEFYNNGDLKFEGEYLNGVRHGKGKQYDTDGVLEFEGDYLNGKKWNGKTYGTGKKTYPLIQGKGYVQEFLFGKIRFEGEYLNGERNGKYKE